MQRVHISSKQSSEFLPAENSQVPAPQIKKANVISHLEAPLFALLVTSTLSPDHHPDF